ncbi:MAG: hypothetical protein M3R35_05260, partial [Candidatus Eremiobacteraeota bacterium]|nr:hypothetical protein [Candidatus Eremiobacteraeota bacterium]
MKFDLLLDASTQTAVFAPWLRDQLEPASEYGRRVFERIEPFAPGSEAAAQQCAQRTIEMAGTLDPSRADAIAQALRNAPDAVPAIARAAMGETLDDAHFLELLRMLDAAANVLGTLGDDASAVASALERGRSGKFGFYLSDDYAVDLREAREGAGAAQSRYDAVRARAVRDVAIALKRDDLSGDEFIIMRDEVRGALPSGVRVSREAPTYVLCEIDHDET